MAITAEDKIARAKTAMLTKNPFFAILAFERPVVIADWLETMATDGKEIFASRKFIEDHTEAELAGVMAHEVLHMALLHVFRLGFRDPKLWNIACDHAVNDIVLAEGFALPKDRVHDKKFAGMAAPEIYEYLLNDAKVVNVSFPSTVGEGGRNPDDGGQSGGQSNGKPGDKEMWGGMVRPQNADGSPLSEPQLREREEEVRISVQQAAEVAKSRGKLPASMKGYIEALEKPVVDWKAYIQQWISGIRPDDMTWRKPNRKMLAVHGVYMPTVKRSGAGVGLLSIDTSGSVSDDELKRYVSEILGMIETVNPEKVIIIQHDAIIQKVDIWEPGEDFTGLHISGRGGTCIRPSFDYAANMDEPIDWMICFTDMGIGDYPHDAPSFPVLWCATGPDNAPFGTYIDVKDAI